MTYTSPTWVDVPPGQAPPAGAPALDSAHLQPLTDAVAALSAGGGGFTIVGPKTANYTAQPGEFVLWDTTSASKVMTLPTSPADKTVVGAKLVILGMGNTVTINCAGSDVFNKTGGGTSLTLSLLDQAFQLEYVHSTGVWVVTGIDLTLSSLNATYVPSTVVGGDVISLGSAWDLVLSQASFLDTASMGTLKTLGNPGGGASEVEFNGVAPVIADDGLITCTTAAPSATATSTLLGTTTATSGSTWTTASNATGAHDTNRAVFTTAVANAVGYIDVGGYDVSSIPSGSTITSVVVTNDGFADSDSEMPYTYQPVDGSGTGLATAQAANNVPTFTFTGITQAQLATMKIRIKATHANDSVSSAIRIDSVPLVVNYTPPAHYRSEVVFTSDLTDGSHDYTVMRFHPTDRIRVAFDVLTASLNTQDASAWNVLFQGIGKSVNGAFPSPNIELVAETSQFTMAGGQAVAYSEAPSRLTHEDGRWYRFEFDIVLGGPGVGKVNGWCDGIRWITDWFPTAGTYYAGNSNNSIDLQYIYFKNGLYGQEFAANAYTPKSMFRNRRFSATVSGVTTTWRGPQTPHPGLKIYKRNPSTDMPY